MQRHLAALPQGKPTQEPNEDQRKQENRGFGSGVTWGATATQKKKGKRNKVDLMGMELMSPHAQTHPAHLCRVWDGFLGGVGGFTLGFISNQLHNKSCNVRHVCVIITGIITTMKPFILMAQRGFEHRWADQRSTNPEPAQLFSFLCVCVCVRTLHVAIHKSQHFSPKTEMCWFFFESAIW